MTTNEPEAQHDPYASTKSNPDFEPATPATPPPLVAPVHEEAKEEYTPIPIKPDISIKLMVGPRNQVPVPEGVFRRPIPLQNCTILVRHQDSVIDILARISRSTDGTLVMLKPGTSFPFQMEDRPYDILRSGVTVSVVPNEPREVGPDAIPSAAIPPDAEPKEPFIAKVMRDTRTPARPDITVNSAIAELVAVKDGYVEVTA